MSPHSTKRTFASLNDIVQLFKKNSKMKGIIVMTPDQLEGYVNQLLEKFTATHKPPPPVPQAKSDTDELIRVQIKTSQKICKLA